MAKGKLVQFRRGRHTVKERQYLVELEDSSNVKNRTKANEYVGSEVKWQSPTGRIIKGQVSAPHGNSGILRAIFEKGLPGQAIGSEVTIEEAEQGAKKGNKSSNKNKENKEK